MDWETSTVGADFVLAPDGSEIRPLVTVSNGSTVHCTLAAGRVTRAVQHRTVEEVWYCIKGGGQLWRTVDGRTEVTALTPGVAISIPLGVGFQFRADAHQALEVVIATMPPWPGEDEAFPIEGAWEPNL